MKTSPAGRLARAAAAFGLAAAGLGAGGGPAAAAPQPIGQCTTTSGAVLAVDFSRWGGPVYRSCGTTPTTGYELLNQGGWRTTGTGHDGPAFICRIGYSGHRGGKQFPPPEQEDCVLTPPASAYWSYWHADPGRNTWTYSQLGAMLYRPKPGSVDLWIFGGTDIGGTKGRPTVTPDQLRAHNTRPTGGGKPAPRDTRTAPPPPPGTDTGPAPGPATPPSRRTPAPPPAKTTAPPSSPPPSSPRAPASTAPATSPGALAASGPVVVDAAPAAAPEQDRGSYLPAAATGVLVLLIGAGAYAAHRRRRSG
ncbi:hypothetical protein ACIBCM_07465 [Streptomyces sp. NPDC051018]|uniref:hypothetical protein n=1 Tax=Streptomyces sp. NPDC051018 TaxID=3365639 RepID=UPI0037AA8F4B